MADFKPAPGVRLFIVDDASIVYAHAAQKLYAFNTAATFIWCGLELGQGKAEVARGLAETAGLSVEDAGRRVAAAMRLRHELGLLGSGAGAALRPPRRRRKRARRPDGHRRCRRTVPRASSTSASMRCSAPRCGFVLPPASNATSSIRSSPISSGPRLRRPRQWS